MMKLKFSLRRREANQLTLVANNVIGEHKSFGSDTALCRNEGRRGREMRRLICIEQRFDIETTTTGDDRVALHTPS